MGLNSILNEQIIVASESAKIFFASSLSKFSLEPKTTGIFMKNFEFSASFMATVLEINFDIFVK